MSPSYVLSVILTPKFIFHHNSSPYYIVLMKLYERDYHLLLCDSLFREEHVLTHIVT